MALSNWDIAAWNKDGIPTVGNITVNNITVEIYKNWIYVRDQECWKEEYVGFGQNVVMQIQFGDIEYRGFRIQAVRGPQDSIMAVVRYGYNQDENYQALYAIGGYAYYRNKCIGITEKTIERFRKHKFFREECIEFPEFKELRRYNQGDAFIVKELYGNSPKTVCTRVGEQSNTILSQLLGA